MARGPLLKPGKLPPLLLAKLLRSLPTDSTVRIGPALGEDTAAITLGKKYLITKTDPITMTALHAPALLIQVNSNDLATRGCRPRYLQVTALLPPKTTAAQVTRMFRELDREARRFGIAITGGHTEITDAVTRPILVGEMIGFVPRNRLISSAGARAGDVLLMAGAAGIEGTVIIAHQFRNKVVGRLGSRKWREAKKLAMHPGTSVLEAGLCAARIGAHAMHDPTEGGLGAAIHEMAHAAHLKIVVDLDCISIPDITRQICALFSIDPLGLISSGALLIAVSRSRTASLVSALKTSGIGAAPIGVFKTGRGVTATRKGRPTMLPWFESDELLKAQSRFRA
jgi:hydrogenase maturation factor